MKKIIEDIKNNEIGRFYLLYGQEGYLKRQYRDKLVKALVSIDDNMNYTSFDGKGFDVNAFVDIGETLPFFSDNRVIVIENSGLFKKSSNELEKRIEKFPESTHVIFVETEVDKRLTLWKWFKKNGYAAEMKPLTESELRKWIGKMCRDNGKQIYENAVELFVGSVGFDMYLIRNEMDKLLSYVGDREVITVDDIREICVDEAEDTIYAMLDAIGARDREEALALYRSLLEMKMNAHVILSRLSFHIKRMMEISGLLEEGKSNDEIASITGTPKWTLGKYKAQIKKNGDRSFKQMLDRCTEIDEWSKTGRIMDVVGAELLIVEFSS